MKDELIQVISRHVEIDPGCVNIEMAQEGREQRLIADIPIAAPPNGQDRISYAQRNRYQLAAF